MEAWNRRSSIAFAVVIAFAIGLESAPASTTANQLEPESGGELLASVLGAHGGLDAFRAVRDWHIVAERRLLRGDVRRETYEEWVLRDGSSVMTLLTKTRETGRLVFGHDGESGFALVDGVRRRDDGAALEAYYRAHGEYYLRAIPFKWADPGVRVSFAGREGQYEILRIEAEPGTGTAWRDVWVAAIDTGTRLLYEARLTHHRAQESWMERGSEDEDVVQITYRYSDYRPVAGLMVPHRLEYLSRGQKTGENVIRTMEVNSGLAPEHFRVDSFIKEKTLR